MVSISLEFLNHSIACIGRVDIRAVSVPDSLMRQIIKSNFKKKMQKKSIKEGCINH